MSTSKVRDEGRREKGAKLVQWTYSPSWKNVIHCTSAKYNIAWSCLVNLLGNDRRVPRIPIVAGVGTVLSYDSARNLYLRSHSVERLPTTKALLKIDGISTRLSTRLIVRGRYKFRLYRSTYKNYQSILVICRVQLDELGNPELRWLMDFLETNRSPIHVFYQIRHRRNYFLSRAIHATNVPARGSTWNGMIIGFQLVSKSFLISRPSREENERGNVTLPQRSRFNQRGQSVVFASGKRFPRSTLGHFSSCHCLQAHEKMNHFPFTDHGTKEGGT